MKKENIPQNIRQAMNALYVVGLLDVVCTIMWFPSVAAQVQHDFPFIHGGKAVIGFAMSGIGLWFFLVFLLGRKANWVRYLLAISFIWSLRVVIPLLAHEPIAGVINIVKSLFEAFALIQLFSAPAKKWFQKPSL